MKNPIYINLIILLTSRFTHAQVPEALGPGLNGLVYEIKPFGNDVAHDNDIYAGGEFTDAGGDTLADYIARWDGSQWRAVAPDLNGAVYAIAFDLNRVYVGGAFTNAGGNQDADYIAFWDGIEWHSMGSGLNNVVYTIVVHGDLVYAGGAFNSPSGNIDHIAYWDETNWNPVGTGLNQSVETISFRDNEVIAGGWFTDAGGEAKADYVARWDGSSWKALGQGLDGPVLSIKNVGNLIYASGLFTELVGKWSVGWTFFNPPPPLLWEQAVDIITDGSTILVSGFDDGVYMEDGTGWKMLSPYINPIADDVFTMISDGSYVYMGGAFFMDIPGTNNIARFKVPELTSLAEAIQADQNDLHVFPNPFHDIIHFTMQDDVASTYELSLTDMTGKVVLQKHISEREIETGNLPEGHYFLQVFNNKKTATARIIKQ